MEPREREPELTTEAIHYEMAGRAGAISAGGVGVMHQMVNNLGSREAGGRAAGPISWERCDFAREEAGNRCSLPGKPNRNMRTTKIEFVKAAVTLVAVVFGGCTSADSATTRNDDMGSADNPTGSSTAAEIAMPGDCSEQMTQEACLAVPEWELFPRLDSGPSAGCSWHPTYRVVDRGTCEVEPFSGTCVPPSSDDGCTALNGLLCPDAEYDVGYVLDEDGTVRLGLGNDCYTGPLSACPDDAGMGTGAVEDDGPIECACACSIPDPR